MYNNIAGWEKHLDKPRFLWHHNLSPKGIFAMEKKRMKVNMNLVELLYRMGKINTATYKAIKRKMKG